MHSYNFLLAHGLLFNKRPFAAKLPDKSRETTGQKEIEEHAKLTKGNSIEDLASFEKYNVLLEIE